ncbi:MAG: multidrug effflux MFS transporter [Candidatus Saccharibacteria bacterium]|nr:multidrug effflux MFS transporter [Pseudorhodobacter sp.]
MQDATRLSQREFVAMMAMLFATTALSIDAMLPALPAIAAELTPGNVNNAQLVISLFFAGLGFGTLIAGPVSDAVGRKLTLLVCAGIYLVGTVLCTVAHSLELLLFARFLQGVGACGPRAVGMAVIRDMYRGRDMAQIVSFVMMVFALVPAAAPLMGQIVLQFGSWRLIFVAFFVFAILIQIWVAIRQPETLPPDQRRPLQFALLVQSGRELMHHRTALISIACQALTQGCLLATLSSQQGIFEQRFDRAGTFPLWFAFIALCSISGSFINSRTVVQFGMRRVLVATYVAQVSLTLAVLTLDATGVMPEALVFPAHILWSIGIFAMMGLSMGNLNALAMEDLGHIAGFAASAIAALSTMGAVLIAVPVGLAFNGTQIPLMMGVAVFSVLSLTLIQFAPKTAAARQSNR